MTILQVIVLAIIQGLTEFLPISSSAHLILVPRLTSWSDQGMMFDVFVHVGTLTAVVVYFRNEVGRMARDWVKTFTREPATPDTRLAWAVIVGTLPVVIAGGLLYDVVHNSLRNVPTIFVTTVVFGLLLGIAYTKGKRQWHEYTLTMGGALLIGIAQAVALVPGTSRSGITITVALLMGLTGAASARFSFLLSIPVIIVAGGHSVLQLAGDSAADPGRLMALVAGGLMAGVTAYTCIYFFLRLIQRIGMWPFVGYRLALGGVLLAFMLAA